MESVVDVVELRVVVAWLTEHAAARTARTARERAIRQRPMAGNLAGREWRLPNRGLAMARSPPTSFCNACRPIPTPIGAYPAENAGWGPTPAGAR